MKMKNSSLQSYLALLAFCLFSPWAFGQSIVATYTGTYSGTDHGNVKITVDSYGQDTCQFDSAVTGTSTVFSGGGVGNGSVFCISADTTWTASGFPTTSNGPTIQGTWSHIYAVGTTVYTYNGSFQVSLTNNSGGSGGSTSLNPQAISGLWYDPKYSGSGFNIFMSSVGLMVTYYGWDSSLNRLWLTSSIGPTQVVAGTPVTLNMLKTAGGSFLSPAAPSTNTTWGTLTLNLSSCTAGTATLTGTDGSVTENIVLLVGVTGAPGC